MSPARTSIAAFLAAALTGAVHAAPDDRALIGDKWPMLAFAEDRGCDMAITSSGKTMQFRAGGMIPGEAVRFQLTNGDMVPLDYSLYADQRGELVRYYVPFRFHRDGGEVSVNLSAARCSLAASAPWTRALSTIP